MTQQRLTPEWQQLRDAFEQCGYEVSHVRDYLTDVFAYFSARGIDRILELQLYEYEADLWDLHEFDEEDIKTLEKGLTAEAARAAALRWLEAQHGTLDFTQRLNRLTEAQRRTFNREWNQLFDELAERGYKIEWKGSSVWISAGAAETKDFVYIELHHAGGWELRMYAPRSCEIRWDSCEGVRTAIRDWIHIVTGKAASA